MYSLVSIELVYLFVWLLVLLLKLRLLLFVPMNFRMSHRLQMLQLFCSRLELLLNGNEFV